nr:restriction endonuclease [Schlegelella koreensis]
MVQCKQWRAFKVGVQVVSEFYGVMAAQGAVGGLRGDLRNLHG